MMAKKKTKPKAHTAAKHSEIIEQCVIYAQSVAAYEAGFKVDSTGDFDYAGSGKGQADGVRRVRPIRRC
jgi:hypothetical protein